jgi:Putative transposase
MTNRNYLTRYTHRVAISNHRLVAFENDLVSFRWRDFSHGGKQKVMTLTADQFLGRFPLHVMPKGLVRIRHFGLFANRRRETVLARCLELLCVLTIEKDRKQQVCRVAPCSLPCWSSNDSPVSTFLQLDLCLGTDPKA